MFLIWTRSSITFSEQTLGNGIGLREANAIDVYAMLAERLEMRRRDERTDWRSIDSDTLNECYAAPTYMDAEGFAFHLPAFLIAELNDDYDFSTRTTASRTSPSGMANLMVASHSQTVFPGLAYGDRRSFAVLSSSLLRFSGSYLPNAFGSLVNQ